jgi:Uma2 family endonuclease
MTPMRAPSAPGPIVYPDSDGEPMSDNTRQGRWIMALHGNLAVLLRHVQAFVAVNLLWYAKRGFPEERAAPDVFIALGRPRGERGSYKQWEEDDVAPQVVFEVRSPGNSDEEMARKHLFYEDHGVLEYYIYDPDSNDLQVFRRQGTVLLRHSFAQHSSSPLLDIRFDLTGEEMRVFYPDGRPFLTFEELAEERVRESDLRIAAERKLQSTQQELETTRQRATTAEQRATTAEQRATTAEQRAARLAELSGKVLQQQATPEEILELQRLLAPSP